ncbi:uncharacterized protein B0H18DRAFT_1044088, partial [Fomitopsis serialis]|uniref:uncharacterized protein n=1 Tax=Fomitopsis serialis TaxID=139415 RepID=UPI002008195A
VSVCCMPCPSPVKCRRCSLLCMPTVLGHEHMEGGVPKPDLVRPVVDPPSCMHACAPES